MSNFKAVKFSVRVKENAETWQDYSTYVINEFTTALLATSASWSQQGSIEYLGQSDNSDYSIKTAQFRSSASDKYLRVWVHSGRPTYGNVSVHYKNEPMASPISGKIINMYVGNVMKFSYSSGVTYYSQPDSNQCMFLFAIGSSSIGVDFGLDLGLDIPVFSFIDRYISSEDNNPSFSITSPFSGSVNPMHYVIMSDGNLFWCMVQYSSGSGGTGSIYNKHVLYAPDLIIPYDQMDTYTGGAICSSQNSARITYSENTESTSYEGFCVICTSNNGSWDYTGAGHPTYYINTNSARTSDSSSKIVTVPMEVYTYPYSQGGSTAYMMNNGVGFKGWVDSKYIRFVNSTYMPSNNKGVMYRNGEFLCTGTSTLICWDASNPDPFI